MFLIGYVLLTTSEYFYGFGKVEIGQ